ncbi:phosphoglycolate phosphatase [Peristeroidobacter agariperforans]|uniref:phosphoglycolate phosphatase n=1 Tax=Peristeroidobacter agariperforans TaxID=268404 RepID=UPI00101BBF07|nr:phosphoglycolate phosphatase [Peristeroidobacter agariperforans]
MPKLIDCVAAVSFDLDGTIIDTAPDLGAAANMMLIMLGGRPLPDDCVPGLIGAGIDEFVKRVLTQSGVTPDARLQETSTTLFRELYGQRVFRLSRIYSGVMMALHTLRAAGLTLSCVTNKERKFAQPLLEIAGISGFFTSVLCPERPEDRKPSPSLLYSACRQAEVEPIDLLLVGDSRADIEAAHAAGCRVVAVDYGYHRGQPLEELRPDAIVSNLKEIMELSVRPRSGTRALRAIP